MRKLPAAQKSKKIHIVWQCNLLSPVKHDALCSRTKWNIIIFTTVTIMLLEQSYRAN